VDHLLVALLQLPCTCELRRLRALVSLPSSLLLLPLQRCRCGLARRGWRGRGRAGAGAACWWRLRGTKWGAHTSCPYTPGGTKRFTGVGAACWRTPTLTFLPLPRSPLAVQGEKDGRSAGRRMSTCY